MIVAWTMALTTEEMRNFRHILKEPKELPVRLDTVLREGWMALRFLVGKLGKIQLPFTEIGMTSTGARL